MLDFLGSGIPLESSRDEYSKTAELRQVFDIDPSSMVGLDHSFESFISGKVGHCKVKFDLLFDLVKHFLLDLGEGSFDVDLFVVWIRHKTNIIIGAVKKESI